MSVEPVKVSEQAWQDMVGHGRTKHRQKPHKPTSYFGEVDIVDIKNQLVELAFAIPLPPVMVHQE